MEQSEHPIDALRAQDRAQLDITLSGVADLAEHGLMQLLDAMFEDADDLLFGVAAAAWDAGENVPRTDAMRALRLGRKTIREGFRDGLLRTLHGRTAPPQPAPSLADGDELELAIAATNMVTRSLNANRRALFELETRLAWLHERHPAAPPEDVLSPRRLCTLFYLALAPIRLDLSIRLVLYKLFDLLVLSRVGPAYAVLNDFLIERGVLPETEDLYLSAHGRRLAQREPDAAQAVPARRATIHRFPIERRRPAKD